MHAFTCVCVYLCGVCLCHGPSMEVQRQFSQVSFLLVPRGFHGSNSGHHTRQHTSLPAESHPFPRFLWRFSKVETWSGLFPCWQWFPLEHRVIPESLQKQWATRCVNIGAFCSSIVLLPCGWPRQLSIMCQSSHTFPRVSKRERLGSASVLMTRQQFRGRQCVYCCGLLDCGQARLDQVQILGLREVTEFKTSRTFHGR